MSFAYSWAEGALAPSCSLREQWSPEGVALWQDKPFTGGGSSVKGTAISCMAVYFKGQKGGHTYGKRSKISEISSC